MTDEQLAINAQMVVQGKGGNLSDRQQEFAQDILSAYQLSIQLAEWEEAVCKGHRTTSGWRVKIKKKSPDFRIGLFFEPT